MKKILFLLIFVANFFVPSFPVQANPTCVLMKFTDDTRYDAIDSANILSERVLEKMIASKRFNLKEFEPLKENIEARLYDEKVDELTKFEAAVSTGDYNELFEGDGFSENKAQTIATAQVGQIVTPEITQEIGDNHAAEYLIQGTIINLGTGKWLNENLELISSAINQFASAANSYGSNVLGSTLGFLGEGGSISFSVRGIGVQCDIRIIKASTGEVIWSKRVLGVGESSLISLGPVTFGHSNLSSKLYDKAIDKAAQKIVDALIVDMDSNALFVK